MGIKLRGQLAPALDGGGCSFQLLIVVNHVSADASDSVGRLEQASVVKGIPIASEQHTVGGDIVSCAPIAAAQVGNGPLKGNDRLCIQTDHLLFDSENGWRAGQHDHTAGMLLDR
ncbi:MULTISPECIES: hypothetical protein [unclassified Burkholderia]|uniref:hypothetical protein n=1 Tax=unclassified Burkholderia TaxID=2613784 RepID=UPI000F576DAC|nr:MULTISPECIES: hypothetical protein [unclassified Burkholderia]